MFDTAALITFGFNIVNINGRWERETGHKRDRICQLHSREILPSKFDLAQFPLRAAHFFVLYLLQIFAWEVERKKGKKRCLG